MVEPQINTGTPLSSVVSGMGGKSIDTDTYQKGISNIQSNLENVREERKAIPSSAPPAMAPEPQLKDYQTDPMQTFGSFASVLATMGSLMTRRPLTNALNAGAAVMKAKSAGDYTAYQDAFSKWKVNTDNAWKMADWNRNQTKEMYDRLKDDQGTLMDELSVWSKATQDPTLEHSIRAGELQNLTTSREKTIDEIKKNRDLVELQHNLVTDKVNDWKQKNGVTDDSKVPPEIFHKAQLDAKREVETKGTASLIGGVTWTPDAIEKAADAVAGGLKLNVAVPGYGKNNPNRDAVMNRIAEKYPDLDLAQIEADYAGNISQSRSVGTASGKLMLSANLLDKAIPLAREAVAKLDLTDYPSINALENAAKTQVGNPEISAANTALQTVLSDYSALIARNGVSTDATRTAARELVNKNMANGQLNAVFDQMEKERANILEAVKDTKSHKTSNSEPSTRKSISTQEEFDALKSGEEYLEDGVPFTKP